MELDLEVLKKTNNRMETLNSTLTTKSFPSMVEKLREIQQNLKNDTSLSGTVANAASKFEGLSSSISKSLGGVREFLDKQLKDNKATQDEARERVQNILNKMQELTIKGI